jgi:hypothetical protein
VQFPGASDEGADDVGVLDLSGYPVADRHSVVLDRLRRARARFGTGLEIV